MTPSKEKLHLNLARAQKLLDLGWIKNRKKSNVWPRCDQVPEDPYPKEDMLFWRWGSSPLLGAIFRIILACDALGAFPTVMAGPFLAFSATFLLRLCPGCFLLSVTPASCICDSATGKAQKLNPIAQALLLTALGSPSTFSGVLSGSGILASAAAILGSLPFQLLSGGHSIWWLVIAWKSFMPPQNTLLNSL